MNITGSNPRVKSGVMLRENLSGKLRCVFLRMNSGNGAGFRYRTTSGKSTNQGAGLSGDLRGYWLKLERSAASLEVRSLPKAMDLRIPGLGWDRT